MAINLLVVIYNIGDIGAKCRNLKTREIGEGFDDGKQTKQRIVDYG